MHLGSENHLRDAVSIAQINEDDTAVVAAGSDPAAEGYVATDIGGTEGAAEAITVVHGIKGCLAI